MSAHMHTPGPWWVTNNMVRDYGGIICPIVSAFRYPDQDELYKVQTRERKANALLIAAAPDLLAALQGILSGAGRHTIEFDAARAAVEKAIGESK